MFTTLQYLFLLRVPLICGVVLAALGPLAIGPARPLLSGLFDLDATKVGVSAYFAAWLAAACFFSTQLVLQYGAERFGAPALDGWFAKKLGPFGTITEALFFAFYVAAALYFMSFLPRGHAWSWKAVPVGRPCRNAVLCRISRERVDVPAQN